MQLCSAHATERCSSGGVGNDQRSEYRGVLQFIEILSRDRDRYVGFFFFVFLTGGISP
jgi:hypothetical protein